MTENDVTERRIVAVRDEPRHRFRFENAYVHVYDVLFPPGEGSLYHRHDEDTLYVAVTDFLSASQEPGADEVLGALGCGAAVCRPHREAPLTHRVRNRGATEMRLIGAEIKASPPHVAAAPLDLEGVTLEQQKPRVRVYSVALPPGAETGVGDWVFSGLLVCLDDSAVEVCGSDGDVMLSCAAGFTLWQDGPVGGRRLRNVGRSDFRAVLVEWL